MFPLAVSSAVCGPEAPADGFANTTGAFETVADELLGVVVSPRRLAYSPDMPPPGRAGGCDIVAPVYGDGYRAMWSGED